MSNLEEKNLFSQRLKNALAQANHPISPTYLSNEFNLRYEGQPVSVQSANNWLLGKAIPNQDKLSLLAIWLNVSSQWLRFGDADRQSKNNIDLIETTEMDLFLKFRKLNTNQKLIIRNLVDEFLQS